MKNKGERMCVHVMSVFLNNVLLLCVQHFVYLFMFWRNIGQFTLPLPR